MATNKHDINRNEFMLTGPFARKGYDWWWHSLTAINEETGQEKPFFFEFFTCNPALGGPEPVLGQLPENKAAGKRPSYLMVKAGCWGKEHFQLHRFFGWDDVELKGSAPYSVKAADCFCTETEIRGSIEISEEDAKAHPEWMCDSGSLEWDLKIRKDITFNVGYGASKLFRVIKAFEMYWHAEGIKTYYEGTIICNGVRYKVTPETCYGYADKNWGRGFTSPWVWLSSCNLRSKITGKVLENSAFDIGGGRPKIYFLPLSRKLLGSFTYEGTDYEFNFSKFWTLSRTEFDCQETEDEIIWHVRQQTRRHVMETDIRCNKSDMLLVNYEAPDGSKRHNRLWNGGNGSGEIRLYEKIGGASGADGADSADRKGLRLIDHIEARNVGCEYGEYDS